MFSRKDREPIFLFDLEWITMKEWVNSVVPFYKVARTPNGMLPTSVLDFTVPAFAQVLKDNPPVHWMYQAEEVEATSKKPRSGILEAIRKAIEDDADPVPSKVAGCGEAVNILCMTYSEGNFSEIHSMSCVSPPEEKLLVEKFWQLCENARPAGWGIEFADLPTMLAASMRHAVYPTRMFDLLKGVGYLDVMKARFGRNEPCKQRDMAALLGFVPSEADPLPNGGADVAAAYEDGRLPDILTHNRLDIEALRFLHFKYNEFFYSIGNGE